MNFCLMSQYFLTNLFSTISHVWSYSEHNFICNYSKSKKINFIRMIHSTNDLWSHVTRGTTCLISIILSNFSSNSKVSYMNISILLKNNILRLQVSMNYSMRMNILKSLNNASNYKSSLLLIEILIKAHMISKITTSKIFHN